MDILKILSIIIICAILALILKAHKAEYSLFISILAGAFLIIFVGEKLMSSVSFLRSKFDEAQINGEYFSIALKALGIAYLSGFIADLCRDAGQTALASKAEIAGKCAIFLLCVPLSVTLLGTILEFI